MGGKIGEMAQSRGDEVFSGKAEEFHADYISVGDARDHEFAHNPLKQCSGNAPLEELPVALRLN